MISCTANSRYQWSCPFFQRLLQYKQVPASSHTDFDRDICLLLSFRKHEWLPRRDMSDLRPPAWRTNRQLIASNHATDSDDYSNETKVSSWTLIILISLSGECNLSMTMFLLLPCHYLCLVNLNEQNVSSCTKAPDTTRTNACLSLSHLQQMNLITKS